MHGFRRVCLLVVVIVAVTAITMPALPVLAAVAPTPVPQTAHRLASAVAPSTASMQQRTGGQELVSKRTRTSRTYTTGHGGLRTEITPRAQNFQDAAGSWQAIDNTLVTSSTPGYVAQNKANGYRLLLPASLGALPSRSAVAAAGSGAAWSAPKVLPG
jgi:hypothetical protein